MYGRSHMCRRRGLLPAFEEGQAARLVASPLFTTLANIDEASKMPCPALQSIFFNIRTSYSTGSTSLPLDILQLTSLSSLPSRTLRTTILATLVVWNLALPVHDSGDTVEATKAQALHAPPPSLENPDETARDENATKWPHCC